MSDDTAPPLPSELAALVEAEITRRARANGRKGGRKGTPAQVAARAANGRASARITRERVAEIRGREPTPRWRDVAKELGVSYTSLCGARRRWAAEDERKAAEDAN
jgi:hypothetical protein